MNVVNAKWMNGISGGRALVAAGSLAVLLGMSACGGGQVTQATVGGAQAMAPKTGVAANTAAQAQTSAAPAPMQVTLKATEFAYTPNTVQLTVGHPVQLTIDNAGQVDHDIKSTMPVSNFRYVKADNDAAEQQQNADQGVFDVDFNKGHTGQVTFVPTKAGTYQFYCDEPGHKEAGMVGTFVVQG